MAQQFVQAKIKGDKVVVFLKPTCRYCTMAQEVLEKYKFKPGHYECVDISNHSEMDSMQDYFLELTGARTVSLQPLRLKQGESFTLIHTHINSVLISLYLQGTDTKFKEHFYVFVGNEM